MADGRPYGVQGNPGGAEVKSGWRAINDRPYRVQGFFTKHCCCQCDNRTVALLPVEENSGAVHVPGEPSPWHLNATWLFPLHIRRYLCVQKHRKIMRPWVALSQVIVHPTADDNYGSIPKESFVCNIKIMHIVKDGL